MARCPICKGTKQDVRANYVRGKDGKLKQIDTLGPCRKCKGTGEYPIKKRNYAHNKARCQP